MKEQTIESLMEQSKVTFGTSGARGLVSKMTDAICYLYTQGFLKYLLFNSDDLNQKKVAIAGDLRSSTPRIINIISQAVLDSGFTPILCEFIPTPTLAYYAFENKIPSIMVTGSHIPNDRNGIKFNRAHRELLKHEEATLKKQSIQWDENLFDAEGNFKNPVSSKDFVTTTDAKRLYRQRFLKSFSSSFLKGYRIGFFQHSAVGRYLLPDILQSLGAKIVSLGKSNTFISVDTEAVRQEDIDQAPKWVKEHQLDALFSTDGDSDRPLIFDEHGQWLRGDTAGALVSQFLNADFVATPMSCNTNIEKSSLFKKIQRTRIGSPFVIEKMIEASTQGFKNIMGYEANGGFILHSHCSKFKLNPLPTRDALIVFVGLLGLAKEKQCTLSQLSNSLPSRYTMSQRIENVSISKSQSILKWILENQTTAFQTLSGTLKDINQIDGLRLTFENEEVIYIRPSGNAPELRCYNEANTLERVQKLNTDCLNFIQKWLQK